MYNLKPKFKSALSSLIKLIILVGTAYFIYNRLTETKGLNESVIYDNFKINFVNNKVIFLLALSLSIFNWLLEILKWKILVNTQQNINFKAAAKQTLSALTASMLTPNRVGDYIAKSLYFSKDQTKKIIALNFIGHGLQLSVTVVFGIIGLVYLRTNYAINISLNIKIIGFFALFILTVLSFGKGRKWFEKLKGFYKNQHPKLFTKIGFLSVLRYLIFSHQFLLLGYIFGLNNTYLSVMMAIFSMYLLASIWPSLSLTDWMIKGSAAIFVFGFLQIQPLLVMQVSLLMWFFNFAFPAVIGSFFIIQFKTARKISVQV